jgi:molybdate transport system substrate-binding protein
MKFFAALFLLAASSTAQILVAAASDLAPMAAKLEQAYGAGKVRFTLGSSGSLKQQIENGAPYDVFLSANESYVRELADSGFVDAKTIRVYATGRLGLWSLNGAVRSLADLKNVTHVAIPNPQHAPYGVAAKAALESQGLWKIVEPKIVYAENVRQALQFAESGNADAVITSWTLLIGKGILLPAAWHAPIRQTGAVLRSSKHPEESRRFLDFLMKDAARKIFEQNGLFLP